MRIESGGGVKAVVPKVGVAVGDGHSGVSTIVDSEGQHVSAGTADGVDVVECINASSDIGSAIPCVVVADGLSIAVVGAEINCKIQCHNAVATFAVG